MRPVASYPASWYNEEGVVREAPCPRRRPPLGTVFRREACHRRPESMDLRYLQHLFVQYVQGDEAAFAEFYARMYPLLRSWLGRRLPGDEVDDLIQEFFLRLHAHRYLLDPDRPILPYMRTMLEHLLVDALRRRPGSYPADVEMDTLATDLDPGHNYEWDELLRQLPEADRRFIVEHFYYRYSIEEIARRRKVSPGALRVRKYRLIRKLRKLLGGGA